MGGVRGLGAVEDDAAKDEKKLREQALERERVRVRLHINATIGISGSANARTRRKLK